MSRLTNKEEGRVGWARNAVAVGSWLMLASAAAGLLYNPRDWQFWLSELICWMVVRQVVAEVDGHRGNWRDYLGKRRNGT